MGLSFTRINVFKSNPQIGIDPDLQVIDFIKTLDGEIKGNWQILSPTANQRIMYFEMEQGGKPEKVQGSQLATREMALGEKRTSNRNKKNRSK